MCCSGSTGTGWSSTVVWLRRRCCGMARPPAGSWWTVLGGRCGAVGSDRGRGERVPDRRVRPGVGRVGEGPGGRAAVAAAVPVRPSGHHAFRLGTAVPPVGGWRLATVPPTMTTADVQALLDHCDRSSDVGVRDFAMLTLVARLGLRSIEVARLELGDLDWRAGEIVVRGKGRREDRLPLPADVGEALVGYLRRRRRRGRLPARVRHLQGTRMARSAPNWSTTSPSGPAGEPGCAGSGRTGCGTRWRRAAAPWRWLDRDRSGAAASGSGHHRLVCQGRSGHAARRRSAVADGGDR